MRKKKEYENPEFDGAGAWKICIDLTSMRTEEGEVICWMSPVGFSLVARCCERKSSPKILAML